MSLWLPIQIFSPYINEKSHKKKFSKTPPLKKKKIMDPQYRTHVGNQQILEK
jgi:hypothetical protein